MRKLFSGLMAMLLVLGGYQLAFATNGYFPIGYGVINNGLGGAGTALPQDSLASATNPAGLAYVGTRYDVGISFFNPNRDYTVTGNPSPPPAFGLAPGVYGSNDRWFVIPALSANWSLKNDSSLGLAIYGHGGMNTDYSTSTFYGTSPTGVDLSQLFIVPTYAIKFFSNHAVGVSPVFAYQRFQAQSLQAFAPFSSDSSHLSNNGYSNSYGYGAKIGYLGKILPELNFGASYHTRTKMSKFSDYSGLFAEQGGFDIPSSWDLGLSYQVIPAVTLVFDYQQINYNEVNSVGNPLLPNLQTSLLGQDNGAGFGWRDMSVYKLGVQWKSSEDWVWRAGYSIGNQPIPSSEVLFNILAPGVIEQHATIGFTRNFQNNQALNVALVRAFSKSVSGSNPLDSTQTIELRMDEWEADFSYSWNIPGS
ncbi:MAG: OmpP1/FadL family transporter [Nitrospiria bacterium]